ncbi:hypothetical protein LINGRAPRIM_LOCUS1360 [Linum grandiflorum]
MVIMLPMC